MPTKRTTTTLALVLAVALTGAAAALASSSRTASALDVNVVIPTKYEFGDKYCLPGTPKFSRCVRFTGNGVIPGLGAATSTYTKYLPSADEACPVVQQTQAAIAIAGKGELELSRPGKVCGPYAPATVGPYTFEVTAGTGIFTGASGRLAFTGSANSMDLSCQCGVGRDRWEGTITLPQATLDVVAPELTGAVSKTVRVPAKVKRTRVRYTLPTAQDAVDGPLPVTCSPASGSWFRVGTTRVTCSASDSSGNTKQASFRIVVKRR